MDGPLRVIHVGVAGRGGWPLARVADDRRWRSVALVDIHESALAAARERTGLPEAACFTSLAEAAREIPADAAIICTPTATHERFCLEAFAAGLHALTEKGMAPTLATARSMVAAAERAGVRFCVAQNYRYGAGCRALRAALTSGEYGTPAFFDHLHHRRRTEPRTLDYPASVLWDMSCHHFDLHVDWFGPIEAVCGRLFSAPWSKYRDPAGTHGLLEFTSGVRATYELTHIGQRDHEHLEIHTDAGVLLHYSVAGLRFLPEGRADAAVEVPIAPGPPSEQGVLDAFREYLTDGVEPGISGRRNLHVLSVIQAMITSHEHGGRRVRIDEV